MGQITLGVTGSTVGNIEFSADVSSEDSGRILVAYGARFGIVPDSPENATAILRKWFTTVIDNARADVLAYEQQKAAKTASDAVQMITASVSGA